MQVEHLRERNAKYVSFLWQLVSFPFLGVVHAIEMRRIECYSVRYYVGMQRCWVGLHATNGVNYSSVDLDTSSPV